MFIVQLIEATYNFLWGDLFQIPLPVGGSIGISLLIIFLVPAAVYFTIRTRFMQVRLFPDMVRALTKQKSGENGLSPFQTLIVSTATRVGMGNLVGVVAAISAGGAGAVFWMWIMAVLGSATAFIEATLAQLYKEKDPLYGGYRGGPAYYIHRFFERKEGRKKRYVLPAVLFAISGLICWCGISQVISNSVSEHSAALYNDCTGNFGGGDRAQEKCDGQGAGCIGTGDGRFIFCDHIDYHRNEYNGIAGGFSAYF